MAARSHISNSILFTLLMRLHQLKPSPRSRYGRRTGWDFCQHPFHFSPPTSASSPSLCNTNPPTITLRVWLFGLPLWIEERADKSLHGDSAICKSCCSRRVFSFPLSLFSLLHSNLLLVHNPSLFPWHSCIPSPCLILSFPSNLKTLWFDRRNLPCCTLSPFSPFHSFLALML